MKPKFLVSAKKGLVGDFGIEELQTPMLLVTQFAGIKLSADYSVLVDSTDGAFGKAIKRDKFTGELGETSVVKLNGLPQDYLVVFGLGRAQRFGCGAIREMVRSVINSAVRRRVSRVTIPVIPNRTTSSNLTLNQTAHIMKCVAIDVLGAKKSDKELEVEFVCTPQAKRHIQAGLRRQRRSRGCDPCQT